MADSLWKMESTCGREVGAEELMHAREVLRLCPGLSRTELAQTLCEHWGWTSATGGSQVRACMKLLEKLEGTGELRLPPKDPRGGSRRWGGEPKLFTDRTAGPLAPMVGDLSMLGPVRLEVISGNAERTLWTEFVARYHPMGCKRTFGSTLRYFITSESGKLGCILMGSAALALTVRDRWIGWSRRERLSRLPWVINNQRLLIFPWVSMPHLASHVLGQLARRVVADWEARWGYRPVLMETFVDPAQHRGVCYRAAGWELLGETTGEGIRRPHHEYRTTPKLIFVRPFLESFRAQLCSMPSRARVVAA
jgi:hypothetical protein